MAYRTQQDIFRSAPLGNQRVNDLIGNQQENQSMLFREHDAAGKHNSVRVARGVAFVKNAAGTYSLAGASAGITAVTKNGTGDTSLTLSASYFSASPYALQLSSAGSGAGGPITLGYTLVSDTEVRIFNNRGSAWAAEDDSYCVAVHSIGIGAAGAGISTARISRGAGLDPDFYNELASNDGTLRAAILHEHTAAGLHNALEIPKVDGYVEWTGAAYTVAPFYGSITSAAKISAGIVDVTLPGSTYLNNPNPTAKVFVKPNYASDRSEHWKAMAEQASMTNTGNYLTKFRVHLWKRSGDNTWTLTDGSFWFLIHSG